MLGNPTEIKGLIELSWSCRTNMQQAQAKQLYLVYPETQGKVLLTCHLVPCLDEALGVVGIKKTLFNT